MVERIPTPGQIYDSNFAERTKNARIYHPEWSEEEVVADSVFVFGTREEFIQEWLGDEQMSLPTWTEEDYNRNREIFSGVILQHKPGLTDDQLEDEIDDRLGTLEDFKKEGDAFNRREAIRFYGSSKEMLKRVLDAGEISEENYEERMSRLQAWYSTFEQT